MEFSIDIVRYGKSKIYYNSIKLPNINIKYSTIKTNILNENELIFIPKAAKHRLANWGSRNLVVIEMWFGDNLDENDIKRYDDIYQRD